MAIALGGKRGRGDHSALDPRRYYFGYEDTTSHTERRMMVEDTEIISAEPLEAHHFAEFATLRMAYYCTGARILVLGSPNRGGNLRVLYLNPRLRSWMDDVGSSRCALVADESPGRQSLFNQVSPLAYSCPALGNESAEETAEHDEEPSERAALDDDAASLGAEPISPLFNVKAGPVSYLIGPRDDGTMQVVLPPGTVVRIDPSGLVFFERK